jgi:isoleucyl-tRNA synthetase
VTRLAAPLAPLVTEEIWQGLTGGRSVHLEDWPTADEFPADDELVAAMDAVRDVASAALALRKSTGLRVRLPLASLTVVTDAPAALEPYRTILEEELNVKAVSLQQLGDDSLESFGITRRLSINARALGPRLGKQVQQVIQTAKAGDWSVSGDVVSVGDVPLEPGEYDLELQAADTSSAISFLTGGGFVILDTVTTPELEAEGLARDLVRIVQDTRKAAGLDVSDRIDLTILGSSETDVAALTTFGDLISTETLATSYTVSLSAQPSVAALDGAAGTQRATIDAGKFANAGELVVDVRKAGATNV